MKKAFFIVILLIIGNCLHLEAQVSEYSLLFVKLQKEANRLYELLNDSTLSLDEKKSLFENDEALIMQCLSAISYPGISFKEAELPKCQEKVCDCSYEYESICIEALEINSFIDERLSDFQLKLIDRISNEQKQIEHTFPMKGIKVEFYGDAEKQTLFSDSKGMILTSNLDKIDSIVVHIWANQIKIKRIPDAEMNSMNIYYSYETAHELLMAHIEKEIEREEQKFKAFKKTKESESVRD